MKTADILQQLDEQITELRQRRSEIVRESFDRETMPNLRDLLGKTFAYRRNSYSSPQKPSDYWDVFRKVLRIVENKGSAWFSAPWVWVIEFRREKQCKQP